MKKPTKKEYGYIVGEGWQSWEGELHYKKDLEAWKTRNSRKPQKSDFGCPPGATWESGGNLKKYLAALKKWESRPKNPGGRPRTRDRHIHPSWELVLKCFDSTNPQRSQGAFCRWAGLKRASFSSWQTKPLRDDVERWILEWEFYAKQKGKEVENG